ncbi:EAL domain-containing protein [Candidatus Parabeggiatoa sp. HSG14]|uniref:EAL domain-containing protein n=1 Tax=Candidatus Parabeggiatoa sp. HSG14 TaxID=3055593 RepID=UPI0025A8B1F9|nr:EAL domain-containing protein [Thiotrichales bacterium HSG14]
MTNTQAHILVVDDAPLIRGLLEKVLQKYGYTVETAEDGQQAIDYFVEHHPDLILMDADMPVLDGVEACTRIRKLPEAKNLPIIIVTAFIERQWIDRAYAAGATDYITKPVNVDVLRNRIHYILQAKRAEEALFEEKEKAQITLASIGDGVITTDAKGQVEYLNAVATKLTGWSIEDAQGLELSQVFSIIDEKTQQPLEFPIQRCLEEGKMVELAHNAVLIHCREKKKFAIEDSAAPIKDRDGHIIGVVLVFHDVTETRKMTQELAYKAKHDALTGLYNRHEFNMQLNHVLQNPHNENTAHALLYMDLDRFKIVNDTCGHEAGDQLLKDVAFILQKKIDAHTTFDCATLARLGGDEFALLLENCALQQALKIAKNLCESIESFQFYWSSDPQEKNIFTIGVSIGLVPISHQTINPKSVLAMADAACYAAKNAGRNDVHVYQENDNELVNKDIQWFSLLNNNLETEQGFSLFYQPIIPLQVQPDTGNYYEILLRMADLQGHLLPPGAFLSAAIRYNLMPALDLWVIQTLLKWLNTHPEFLEQTMLCTLNISGHSINDKNFLPAVISSLDNTVNLAHKLCFEITETTALTNITGVLNFITTLKKLGCRFGLDNFGSGVASFAHLKIFPVDFLKIDGTFIKNMTDDTVGEAMVKAINDIAHLMHIPIVAESVENQTTLDRLKEIGVDYVQGYWIAEPKPLEKI